MQTTGGAGMRQHTPAWLSWACLSGRSAVYMVAGVHAGAVAVLLTAGWRSLLLINCKVHRMLPSWGGGAWRAQYNMLYVPGLLTSGFPIDLCLPSRQGDAPSGIPFSAPVC